MSTCRARLSSVTRTHRPGRGFTLIEILVVVAIIALLIAILMPSLAAARRQSQVLYCSSNLKTIAQATFFYCESNQQYMPASGIWSENVNLYVQRLSGGKTTATGKLEGRVDFFLCPGDEIPHTSGAPYRWIDNDWKQIEYKVSYGISNGLVWGVKSHMLKQLLAGTVTVAASRNFDESERVFVAPGKYNVNFRGMRRISEVPRASEIIMFLDSGDDDLTGDQNWDFSQARHNVANIQVHHTYGNNFAYADQHVEHKKVLPNGYQKGKPPFPWAWIPEDGWKFGRDNNPFEPTWP